MNNPFSNEKMDEIKIRFQNFTANKYSQSTSN